MRSTPVVFFNASVVLAALQSPSGGSAQLIKFCQSKKIKGIISEIVLDEIIRNLSKIKTTQRQLKKTILSFHQITPAPKHSLVKKYQRLIIDLGDAHLFSSCQEIKTNYLVSLDKKHVLNLSKRIKKYLILNPKELLKIIK